MKEDLRKLIGDNEKILYEGKPNLKCFIFEGIFNPMLPFAIVWALFDSFFLGAAIAGDDKSFAMVLIPFLLLHMMPVWIYLAGAIFTIRRYRNTEYVVTDRAVYITEGIFTKNFKTKPFAELSHVDLKRGIFDQMFNVGDIILTSSQQSSENGISSISINSISNYDEVYKIVSKLQEDIYTDIMYPNDKRPKENHGYKTEYKG